MRQAEPERAIEKVYGDEISWRSYYTFSLRSQSWRAKKKQLKS